METNEPKGLKSTEFILTVLACLISVGLLITNRITSEQWIQLMAYLVPGYGISRGLAKIGQKK